MKILFSVAKAFRGIYKPFVKQMENCGAEVTCLIGCNDKATIIRNIKDADIYILAVSEVDKEIIDSAVSLKYIIKLGTGVDNIDVNYAAINGISVSNAPGQNASSVAELAIGLMIDLSRQVPYLDSMTKTGKWVHSMGFELQNKVLGIIGFGTIGRMVAKLASAFNMHCIAFGHYKDCEVAKSLNVNFVELDDLLSRSDYILVSTSLKKSNYHLINRDTLAIMKSTSFLVNISRGALVDEQAVIEAIKLNNLAGAALDVLENEPPEEDEFPKLDNLILTPHIGGSTLESVWRIANVTIDNIKRFSNNSPLLNVVNQELLVNKK